MLQQFFHIIIVSITCIIWGIPVLLILPGPVKRDQFWYHSKAGLFCFLFFCGCLLISILSSWIYLVFPLKFFTLFLFTLALLIYLFLFQRKKIGSFTRESSQQKIKLSFIPLVFIIAGLALFVLLSALLPVNGDTQIYHLQIIRWESEYKVVPGVANLFPRFGLGSSWFNLISFFYWPSFKNENFTYLNASFVIWFFLWLFSKWYYYFQMPGANPNNRFISFFYFLLLLYCMFDWQLYRDAANSTNYDFAVNAFTIIVSSFFIEGIFTNKARNQFSFIILLFSLCAVSFKLSGIFIFFLVLHHTIVSRKTVKWIFAIFLGIVILLPVLVKNYISTGYPLFPSPIAINTPDWMLPKEMATGLYRHIILSNRFYNYSLSFINKFEPTSFNWIPYWFNGILWKHKIILALALSSIFFLFKRTSLDIDHKSLRAIIIIFLLMLAGWFFTAPDPGRFGYGIILSLSFLTVSLFVGRFLKAGFYMLTLALTTIIIIVYAVKKSPPVIKHPSACIYPIFFAEPPYQVIKMNNIDLKLPGKINDNWDCRCYFLSLPCITQKNPYLQARGENVKEGFRMYPQPDSNYIRNYLY